MLRQLRAVIFVVCPQDRPSVVRSEEEKTRRDRIKNPETADLHVQDPFSSYSLLASMSTNFLVFIEVTRLNTESLQQYLVLVLLYNSSTKLAL